MAGVIGVGAIVVIVCVLIITNIRIVPQSCAFVIERLGTYHCTWEAGIHVKAPFIDSVVRKLSLKEKVNDFPPQPVITKDNVTMEINTVVFHQVTDPKLNTYGIDNPIAAIENLTATTLRNVIGEIELDATLTSRETINTRLRSVLDEATDAWGIKVTRVELKDIVPPVDIIEAMQKQMVAERARREAILKAEGEKKSAILKAEGHKESVILEAEAEKESMLLRAEAQKQRAIKVAEGEAEAIKIINEAKPSVEVLKLRGLETFEKVADGKATKLIIPSEIQNLTSLLSVAKESIGEIKEKEINK
ncbi:SPFH domain-containing protein [Oceanirhabdus sp. W0125-5]|uniref:SPFH domain-containing protein n=1 Tax=Oceanirhabdus sp. W0125-5 TaxID=2999116 RepID=UPI0022F2DF1C|nr:SPFH domain-containing protein [Oceanirhabdus sp. W0125-5]WBW98261.1 SPFH/Band 7/PHB domain protein [Oceanirhabdus sp. W0125-5]